MTKRFWSGVIGLGMLTWTVGCARENPVAPSNLNARVAGGPLSELTTTSYPVVTLQPDLTANPSVVTVQAGKPVLMVNNSTRYVLVRSYNCDEFLILGLQPGVSRYSWPFQPAGKTCDYFVWDYPRKIFVGQVVVQ
jgi:hypothetical protein